MQYKIRHGISSHPKVLRTASSLSRPSLSPGFLCDCGQNKYKGCGEKTYVSCFDIRVRGCVRIGVGEVGCGLGIVVSFGGFEFVKA